MLFSFSNFTYNQSTTSRQPSELFWTTWQLFSNDSDAADHQQHIQMAKNTFKNIHNISYICCCLPSQTSHLISPEHQDHLQIYFEPPENCFWIIQTKWTTNNAFGQPKTHSKTHSQYNIYMLQFSFLNFTSNQSRTSRLPSELFWTTWKLFSNHSSAVDHQQHIRMVKNTFKTIHNISYIYVAVFLLKLHI